MNKPYKYIRIKFQDCINADPDFCTIINLRGSAALGGKYELSECFLFPRFFLGDNNCTLVGLETHTSALCGEMPLGALDTHSGGIFVTSLLGQ